MRERRNAVMNILQAVWRCEDTEDMEHGNVVCNKQTASNVSHARWGAGAHGQIRCQMVC